jgi:Ethanolamine utilization protein EutJ (predicted chaperonin)
MIYSADHPEGMGVEWAAIPRVGDSIVLPFKGVEKTYEVEVVRWLLDEAGKQIGIEVHMGIGFGADSRGQGENSAASSKDSLALAS